MSETTVTSSVTNIWWYLQDYLVVSFKNTSTHMSGIHVIERASGRPARNGIMHDGASFAPYDVITFDAHRQPFVYGEYDDVK